MDRNAFTGLLLIGVILFAWQYFAAPSAAEEEAMRQRQDSILQVEAAQAQQEEQSIAQTLDDSVAQTAIDTSNTGANDSLVQTQLTERFGRFAPAASGNARLYTLQNSTIKASIDSRGAAIRTIELKDYQSYQKTPLLLMAPDSTRFDLAFQINGRTLHTEDLYFAPFDQTDSTLVMRAQTDRSGEYLDLIYSLPAESRFIGLEVHAKVSGLEAPVQLDWKMTASSKEKSLTQEKDRTTLYYRYLEDSPDYLSERGSDEEVLEERTQWVSFKEQFFSTALIYREGFTGGKLSVTDLNSEKFTKSVVAQLDFALEDGKAQFELYAGPNKYNILNKYDLDLEDQIDLGWGIFGWISKILIIPVFDFLSGLNLHYGLIILLLTLFIKLLLFPVTYKTYLSSAKMRSLRPEIDEINAQYDKGEEMKKQQAMMQLYRSTGVNPFSGCIPMLIQFPILFAMFRFFPASIELRGQSFLWADDLSSYDSIYSWNEHIWLISDIYGNHISGFTLLMAISTFFYTKLNTQVTMTTNSMQAQQMKIMTYFMPVMLLFFFNGYSSGLSLYYFTANVTTMIQQFVIKRFIIDEDKIREKIQSNKNKPKKKKKGRFQAKMEELAEQQQVRQNRQMRRKK